MALITRRTAPDEKYRAALPALIQRVSELKRDGVALGGQFAAPQADPWRVVTV
ncbi:MAG TPA: hypothetical protein VFS27_12135 [Blastocatellia bacterium]|nr:hypothetical protein [Blastocatellia bacterium]